jgi:hypothetical protein
MVKRLFLFLYCFSFSVIFQIYLLCSLMLLLTHILLYSSSYSTHILPLFLWFFTSTYFKYTTSLTLPPIILLLSHFLSLLSRHLFAATCFFSTFFIHSCSMLYYFHQLDSLAPIGFLQRSPPPFRHAVMWTDFRICANTQGSHGHRAVGNACDCGCVG